MAHLVDWLVRVLFVTLRIMFPCSLLLLASCTKPMAFPQYMTVADVINNIKCELYLAIHQTQNKTWLKGWTAAFTVQLQVKAGYWRYWRPDVSSALSCSSRPIYHCGGRGWTRIAKPDDFHLLPTRT